MLVANVDARGRGRRREGGRGWNPYRTMFDVVWSGRRHVMMGATQIDRFGNQNIAFIGDVGKAEEPAPRHARRARQHRAAHHQLLGPQPLAARCSSRRSTWSRASATTAPRSSGRRRALPRDPARRLQPRRCSTSTHPNIACGSRRVHPGVTVDDVVAATGFELVDRRRRAREPSCPRARSCG